MENLRKKDNLRTEAKRWLKALRANDPDARARFTRAYPKAPALPVLRDVQHALACEHGYDNWAAMKHALERPAPTSAPPLTREGYERLAQDYVQAFDAQDATALQRMNVHYNRTFTFDDLFSEIWHRVYAFRQRSSKVPKYFLKLDEAQMLVAQNAGFGSWDSLIASLETGASPIPPYSIDTQRNAIVPRRMLSDREWDQLIALMKERRIEGLAASGLMTDALIARIAELDHVIALGIGGSRGLSDDGLLQLARMPQLRWLNTRLLIDGPFTNAGLASLTGLDGVFDLDLSWHVTGITSDGFAHLAGLPNLGSLGVDGKLSDDEAMRHFGAIPRLRKLRAQGTVARDEGFEALSRSQTLEQLWTRETPHLGSRGFIALSRMPSLRTLGVSCKQVNDEALATLPDFPSLRELTPIDVTDTGFRHIGRCAKLERLSCMYCRETTDVATEHIGGLQLRSYYAGLTQITDRSLEILGRMGSLERIELYECLHVTDAGRLSRHAATASAVRGERLVRCDTRGHEGVSDECDRSILDVIAEETEIAEVTD